MSRLKKANTQTEILNITTRGREEDEELFDIVVKEVKRFLSQYLTFFGLNINDVTIEINEGSEEETGYIKVTGDDSKLEMLKSESDDEDEDDNYEVSSLIDDFYSEINGLDAVININRFPVI